MRDWSYGRSKDSFTARGVPATVLAPPELNSYSERPPYGLYAWKVEKPLPNTTSGCRSSARTASRMLLLRLLSVRTRRSRYMPEGHDAVVLSVVDADQFEQS